MMKAEEALSVQLTCAHGLSSVCGCLKHHMFVTLICTLFFASTLALWTVGTGMLELGKRDSPLTQLATHLLVCYQRAFVNGS